MQYLIYRNVFTMMWQYTTVSTNQRALISAETHTAFLLLSTSSKISHTANDRQPSKYDHANFLRITYRYPWLMIKIWGRNDATSNFGIPLNVSMVKWCANKMYMAPLISAGYMKTFKCAPVHAPRKEYFSQLLSTVVEHDITSHLTSNFTAFLIMMMTILYLITFGHCLRSIYDIVT